jgi:hypothetical protein
MKIAGGPIEIATQNLHTITVQRYRDINPLGLKK